MAGRVPLEFGVGGPSGRSQGGDVDLGCPVLMKAERDAVDDEIGIFRERLGGAVGGVLFGIAHEMGVPIRYIGVGEAAKDLRPFDAGSFVNAILPID